MKAAYLLQLEQHQRRIGLTHKELNKLDRKHNAINLLKQLQLLDPKVSAPAPPAPPTVGWSGTITFVKQAGGGSQQFITIKKETGPFIATDYIYNSGSNVFSVSLANPSSYLYISMYGSGSWDITNDSFSQAVGSGTYVAENNRGWLRYTIPSQFIGSNLTYNFSTFYND
jgi:hypothetical protein